MMKVTEKEFANQIEGLLDTFHWRWCHFRPASTKHGWTTALSGHPGFPDYIAVKDGSVIVIELKSEKGKVSPDQQLWLEAFKQADIDVYLWRPSDFDFAVSKLRG